MKKVLLDKDEPAYLDQNSKTLLRAARQTAFIVRLDTTNVVFGGKAFSGFRGLARAPCGHFRCSPGPQKLPTKPTFFQLPINFHRRKIFLRIFVRFHKSQPDASCARPAHAE